MNKILYNLFLIGCICFIVEEASCQSEPKNDVESQLKSELLQDADFKQVCVLSKEMREKAMVDYYNYGKSDKDYLAKHAVQLDNGDRAMQAEILKKAGVIHAEEFIEKKDLKFELTKKIKNKHLIYINSYGDKNFGKLWVKLITEYSKPNNMLKNKE